MRRFKSSPRPLLPPRAPEPAPGAVGAEAARDDFNAEIAEIAEGLPENFSAFSARSAFQTGSAPLLPPRAPEPAPGAVGAEAARDDFNAEIAEGLPENFSAFSARSAFQTGSAPSASPARSRAGTGRCWTV